MVGGVDVLTFYLAHRAVNDHLDCHLHCPIGDGIWSIFVFGLIRFCVCVCVCILYRLIFSDLCVVCRCVCVVFGGVNQTDFHRWFCFVMYHMEFFCLCNRFSWGLRLIKQIISKYCFERKKKHTKKKKQKYNDK